MIRDALNAFAASSDREWARDRNATVGASEVGRCARLVYFLKNENEEGYHHDRDPEAVDSWGAKKRGSVYEDAFWAPAIKAHFGERARFVGPEQQTFAGGFLTATPDGVIVDLTEEEAGAARCASVGSALLLDCKSIDPRARLDGPKPEHVFQVQAGMGLVRERTGLDVQAAILSYTNASFWDDVTEFVVPFDPEVYQEANKRARDVMLATSPQYLKPEGAIAGGKECKFCAFTRACGQARVDRVPAEATPVPTQLAETILDLSRAAAEAGARAKAGEDEQRALQEEIKALLAEAGTRRVRQDGVEVTWSPTRGRPSYDDKAIRAAAAAAGVDLSQFSRVGAATDRLAIKILGQSAEVSAASAA